MAVIACVAPVRRAGDRSSGGDKPAADMGSRMPCEPRRPSRRHTAAWDKPPPYGNGIQGFRPVGAGLVPALVTPPYGETHGSIR